MEFLKSLNLSVWWNVVLAIGVAVVIASIAAKDRDAFAIGAGIAAIGLGEHLNHPRVGRVEGQFLASWYERHACISGVLLDAVGGLFVLWGLWRVFAIS